MTRKSGSFWAPSTASSSRRVFKRSASNRKLETPLQSSLMLQLAKVLEWLLGPTLPDEPEQQLTKPGKGASPPRRSRSVQRKAATSATEPKVARKPRRQMTVPNTRQFAEFDHRLPAQGKPADSSRKAKFQRDEQYERSPGVGEALTAIDAGAPAVLVVGRAGTGKTRLVRYLRERPGGERQAVVAPTAIAALNAQAQTIHSFFKLPPLLLDAKALPDGQRLGVLYRRMKRLVIDEISMVRVDLIDAIDARLRSIRGDDRPFGGVQIVMVGDFLQLPPVVESDHRPLLHGLGYHTPYAFSARSLAGLWRFWVSDRAAFACMKLALSAFEADRTHCSGEHGGSVDADREAWVPGKGVPLGALQGGSPGECLFHQIRGDRHDDAGGHREAFGL